jgi:hypothetical protein
MTDKLRRHSDMLRFLGTAKPPVVRAAIGTASPALVETLCECCHNVLKGNVALTPAQKVRLRRHKNNLRLLTQKKLTVNKRKRILQTGGFIGALLGPILGALTGLLRG